MAKATPASITIRRNAAAVTGFDCACGYSYTVPERLTSGPYMNAAHAGNLCDCMVRYHEAKHKKGKA